MAYSALSGTLSAQGYRLQLPPARGVCPTVPSVALCLRRGIVYSYPLRAEHALQCPQWHFVCAGVSSNRRKQPFHEDPARGVCPTVLSVALLRCHSSAQKDGFGKYCRGRPVRLLYMSDNCERERLALSVLSGFLYDIGHDAPDSEVIALRDVDRTVFLVGRQKPEFLVGQDVI